MGPDEIRKLRGSRTRAAFAQMVGVTPLTVYRWELPDGASEARRPRGKKRARLEELVSLGVFSVASAQPGVKAPEAAALHPGGPAGTRPGGASPPPASSGTAQPQARDPLPLRPAEWEIVLPALASLDEGDADAAEAHLVSELANARELSAAGRAFTAVASAHVQLLGRGSTRGLLLSLPPLIATGETERYPALVGAYAHATGALLYALCPAPFRSAAKVAQHASRVRALAGATPESGKLLARAVAAELLVASRGDGSEPPGAQGRGGSQTRAAAFEVVAAAYREATDPLTRCLAAEACACALLSRPGDFKPWEALTLRHAAELHLDAPRLRLAAASLRYSRSRGQRPERALEQVAELRVWWRAEVSDAKTEAELDAAELEALLRLGHMKEAAALVQRLPADSLPRSRALVFAVAEHGRLTADAAALERLRGLVAANPSAGESERCAAADCVALCHDLVTGAPAVRERLQRMVGHAESDSDAAFALDCALVGLNAAVAVRDEESVDALRSRLERRLAEHPSVWHDAVQRRLLAIGAISTGHPEQARGHLEAAEAALSRSGDALQLALLRGVHAAADLAQGRPSAMKRVATSLQELRSLGVVPLKPAALTGRPQPLSAPAAAPRSLVERLATQLERLTLRGLAANQVHQEIVLAAEKLLAPRSVRAVPCSALAPSGSATGAAELTDGNGQRFTLQVEGETSAEESAALHALSIAGSLALEVAHLRAADAPRPPEPSGTLPAMIAASASTRALRDEIARLAASTSTVLLRGESGTGKDVVARALHSASERAGAPYVPFNCASLPRDLFEGQLFGHRKGSFTGATQASEGVIRSAAGGTLFLDEIAELPLEVQPKLLRFLENGEVLPLGDTKPVVVDVRVIAATHRDLADMVRAGDFRQDLYYRLNVIRLAIAPLRERPEDMVALARAFLAELTPAGEKPPLLSPDALAALAEHDWPGNIRELRNVMERAVAARPAPRVLGRAQIQLD